MHPEPLSPELALVDPELGARARAALHGPIAAPSRPPVAAPVVTAAAPAAHREHGRYPLWARVTTALWVLVLGILIGGAAIPHAQDKPRVVPLEEDAPAFCERPSSERPPLPTPSPGGVQE